MDGPDIYFASSYKLRPFKNIHKMLGVQSRKRTLDGSAKPLVLGTLRVPWKMELGAIV